MITLSLSKGEPAQEDILSLSKGDKLTMLASEPVLKAISASPSLCETSLACTGIRSWILGFSRLENHQHHHTLCACHDLLYRVTAFGCF
jgi:hypothetical protein